jgi:thymidylate synthase (FAD)
MKIVQPTVTLVHATPDLERVIERMGRICYQSQHRVKTCGFCNGGRTDLAKDPAPRCPLCEGTGTDIESARAFISMVIQNGHESVLEHAVAGFSIVTDRGVTHEIVRHRLASYSQESTRYCNYGKDQFERSIAVIEPPGLTDGLDTSNFDAWQSSMEGVEHIYLEMLDRGVTPQIARSVLPNSLKSEIGMTANFREWRHFLRLRTSLKAHPQMREVAEMIRAELLKLSTACFKDIP